MNAALLDFLAFVGALAVALYLAGVALFAVVSVREYRAMLRVGSTPTRGEKRRAVLCVLGWPVLVALLVRDEL